MIIGVVDCDNVSTAKYRSYRFVLDCCISEFDDVMPFSAAEVFPVESMR